jgi:hypothetical protein
MRADQKGRMMGDLADGLFAGEGQTQDVLIRDMGPRDPRMLREAESSVELRIADQNAAKRAGTA